MDSRFSMKAFVARTSRTCFFHLKRIRQIRSCLMEDSARLSLTQNHWSRSTLKKGPSRHHHQQHSRRLSVHHLTATSLLSTGSYTGFLSMQETVCWCLRYSLEMAPTIWSSCLFRAPPISLVVSCARLPVHSSLCLGPDWNSETVCSPSPVRLHGTACLWQFVHWLHCLDSRGHLRRSYLGVICNGVSVPLIRST